MANPVLIKIDRNGTKYWADDTCQRCGGAGERSEWYYTGKLCFECGGTGRSKLRIQKEYTDEYWQKLTERRLNREARKLGYESVQAMHEAQAAEAQAEAERREAERQAEEERIKAEKARSNYVGNVGDNLTVTATYEGSPYFMRRAFSGYGMETVYIHRFRDADGNLIIWKTGAFPFTAEEGQTVTVSGKVKEHSEYKDEKQTFLARAKVTA